jgi:hypothetical protein
MAPEIIGICSELIPRIEIEQHPFLLSCFRWIAEATQSFDETAFNFIIASLNRAPDRRVLFFALKGIGTFLDIMPDEIARQTAANVLEVLVNWPLDELFGKEKRIVTQAISSFLSSKVSDIADPYFSQFFEKCLTMASVEYEIIEYPTSEVNPSALCEDEKYVDPSRNLVIAMNRSQSFDICESLVTLRDLVNANPSGALEYIPALRELAMKLLSGHIWPILFPTSLKFIRSLVGIDLGFADLFFELIFKLAHDLEMSLSHLAHLMQTMTTFLPLLTDRTLIIIPLLDLAVDLFWRASEETLSVKQRQSELDDVRDENQESPLPDKIVMLFREMAKCCLEYGECICPFLYELMKADCERALPIAADYLKYCQTSNPQMLAEIRSYILARVIDESITSRISALYALGVAFLSRRFGVDFFDEAVPLLLELWTGGQSLDFLTPIWFAALMAVVGYWGKMNLKVAMELFEAGLNRVTAKSLPQLFADSLAEALCFCLDSQELTGMADLWNLVYEIVRIEYFPFALQIKVQTRIQTFVRRIQQEIGKCPAAPQEPG